MGRLHLVEFEDLSWFPNNLRNYMTDYLQYISNVFDVYKNIIPVLKKGVEASESKQMVDLGAGGGGGWLRLSEHVKEELPGTSLLLTDYYPNISAFETLKDTDPDFFDYCAEPVNAMHVPEDIKGLRTQFLSLHHFRPKDAQQILQNAVDSKSPIAIFEGQQRTVGHFIQFFFSPINVILMTPFIKPFSFGRIFFTYIIPLVPIFVWWDGLVSVLRTYSRKELEALISGLNNGDSFEWEIGKTLGKPVSVYYLLGVPKK